MPATQKQDAFLVTTLKLPAGLRAAIDELRAARTRLSGRRPSTNELFLEAIQAFVERERRAR